MNFAFHEFWVSLHWETIIFNWCWVTTMMHANPWSYKIKFLSIFVFLSILNFCHFFFFCQIFFCQFWIWFSFIKKIGFLKLPQRWRMRWTSSWPRKICTVRWWPRSGFNSAGTTTMNRPIPAQHFLRYWVWFQGVFQSSVSNSATKTKSKSQILGFLKVNFTLVVMQWLKLAK